MRKTSMWLTIGFLGIYAASSFAMVVLTLLFVQGESGVGSVTYSPYGGAEDKAEIIIYEVLKPVSHYSFLIGVAALILHVYFLNREMDS